MRNLSGALTSLLAGLLLVCPAAAKSRVDAVRVETPPAIDGAFDDWRETTTRVDGLRGFVDVAFDDDHLYVSFSSAEVDVARMAAFRGLIARFEVKGREAVEVRFPLGLQASGWSPTFEGDIAARENLRDDIEKNMVSIELAGGDFIEPRVVGLDNDLGVRVAVGKADGGIFYELQVPLRVSEERPFAVGVQPGDTLTLEMENPKIDKAMLPGGRQGRGNPRAAGGDPYMGHGGVVVPDGISAKIKVRLPKSGR